jgi:carbamoyltransferase
VSVDVLGISCFYHDAAAAIVRDGEIVAAAQEERFTRKKHDPRFPRNAINYCLEEAFLEADQLDAVVFYDDPVLSFDRVLKSFMAVAPRGAEQWSKAAQSFLGAKFYGQAMVRDMLKLDVPVLFTRHHLSHAASAFYPSPYERAAVLTIDGVGEWATTSIALGEGSKLETLKEVHFPHSLGLLYSAVTYFCGFKVNSGEYKLMGLAPYGKPIYADRILEHLLHLREDGSFRLDMDYFGYLDSGVVTNEKFHALFDGPPRMPESRISRREIDLAASIQAVTEQAVLALARHAKEITGADHLCLAGGVALNCVANGVLLREKIFEDIWIQPAAGDAGGALGAALAASHLHFDVPRSPADGKNDRQSGSYLGPAFSQAEVRAFLDRHGHEYEVVEERGRRAEIIAESLAAGKIVGFCSGRMEFGPRSLGGRSVLGDPRNPETQVVMNLKIKYRESFRPFAPSVLEERAGEYFDLDSESPYMLLVAPVREERRTAFDRESFDSGDDDLLQMVRQARSDVPAITHVDYSARVQTVGHENQPDYRAVLEAFERRTGCSVLVNTSFNVRGEPIVCTPEDAYRCFMRTDMDLLVLGDCLLEKTKQEPIPDDESWRTEYELD